MSLGADDRATDARDMEWILETSGAKRGAFWLWWHPW